MGAHLLFATYVTVERLEDVSGYVQLSREKAERMLVWDDLDFVAGSDPTAGDTQVTTPVHFAHGSAPDVRTAPPRAARAPRRAAV